MVTLHNVGHHDRRQKSAHLPCRVHRRTHYTGMVAPNIDANTPGRPQREHTSGHGDGDENARNHRILHHRAPEHRNHRHGVSSRANAAAASPQAIALTDAVGHHSAKDVAYGGGHQR